MLFDYKVLVKNEGEVHIAFKNPITKGDHVKLNINSKEVAGEVICVVHSFEESEVYVSKFLSEDEIKNKFKGM